MPEPRASPETLVHCYSRGVSTLATAPSRATPEPAGAASRNGARREGLIADVVLGAALATGFGIVVFAATGGTELAPNTWVEIALIAVGAACGLAVVLLGAAGRAWGAVTVALFAALAALTYASIAWSVQPADSWVEANRTLSYLAAFGAAVALARLAPARWPAPVWAIATVAVVACGYGLLAKVFPASLNASDPFGRLRVPFSYWNATGLMAGLGMPACLWAGARPTASRWVRALTVPAIAVLVTALMLSYSRGGLIAVVIGLACWFVLVPFRLRATLLLALGAIGGAIATAWALKHHAITHDYVALAARTSAGHEFGVVLLGVLAVMAIAGLTAAYGIERIEVAEPVRRRIGTALIVCVAMVPVVAIGAVAASSRGLTGEVSHVWTELTSPTATQPGNGASRLASLGNSRPLYWSEGLKVGEHALLAGVGAGGFDTARTRYSSSTLAVAHAHSLLIETFADFGLIGIAVSFALFGAWALAVARTLGIGTGRRGGARDDAADAAMGDPADTNGVENGVANGTGNAPHAHAYAAERAGLITMLAVIVIFGVSSLIDWTWFVPGVAVPALVCAGWLAGRGPLDAPIGRTRHRRRLSTSPGGIAAGLGIVAATIVAAWFVWQPLHSQDAFDAAITAMSNGNSTAALADAQDAAASNPVAVEPLWELSGIYSARRDPTDARQELVKATTVQPSNPATWEQLGQFDLAQQQPIVAVLELQTAQLLDRSSAPLAQQLAAAESALSKAGFTAPPAPAASS
jgi:O-antigen ligase/polysaccharide polymerase Wzy-like membrane protein